MVAEGIESSAQLERVRGMACDGAQGFHLGGPMDGTGVAAMLGRVGLRVAAGAPTRVPGAVPAA